jgi:hypothetical protein
VHATGVPGVDVYDLGMHEVSGHGHCGCAMPECALLCVKLGMYKKKAFFSGKNKFYLMPLKENMPNFFRSNHFMLI